MNGKPRFIMCNCTGECPGFAKLDFWPFMNHVRNVMDVHYAIIHPQLCVEDGDSFWRDILQPSVTYIVGGCDARMQRKMFKDVFQEKGCDFDGQVVPLDLRNMSTEEAIKRVEQALQSLEEGGEK